MDPLFPVAPEDFAALSVEEIEQFIADSVEISDQIGADPASFVTEERPAAQVLAEMEAGVAAIESARAELASRATTAEAEAEAEEVPDEEVINAIRSVPCHY